MRHAILGPAAVAFAESPGETHAGDRRRKAIDNAAKASWSPCGHSCKHSRGTQHRPIWCATKMGAYGQAFTRRVRAMGIRDRPISPRSPWQNPYAERLIGTLRRDCLDHVLIFGERHLRRVLTLYSRYYNETRTHLGLGKDAPLPRAVQRSGTIVTTPILPGLHDATRGYDSREGQAGQRLPMLSRNSSLCCPRCRTRAGARARQTYRSSAQPYHELRLAHP